MPTMKITGKLYYIKIERFFSSTTFSQHNIFNKELVSRINIFFKTNKLIKTVDPIEKWKRS